MSLTYAAPDWAEYRIDYKQAYVGVEPLEQEIAVVDTGLRALLAAGIIADTTYDGDKLLAHRQFVVDHFEIPWTAITPRMQRLIYALNAITRPANMIAAGVFCGNTFISNAGAGVGPGKCYDAQALVGLEIKPAEAERAERNVRRIDPSGVARVVAADAIEFVRDWPTSIDLLYLDADGTPEQGKGVYLTILEAALDKLSPGALVLAHNSINCAERLSQYLAYVRDPANMKASMNMMVDGEGLEVSRF